jgi:hypothetical protein
MEVIKRGHTYYLKGYDKVYDFKQEAEILRCFLKQDDTLLFS